jgi:hypothetical protein
MNCITLETLSADSCAQLGHIYSQDNGCIMSRRLIRRFIIYVSLQLKR